MNGVFAPSIAVSPADQPPNDAITELRRELIEYRRTHPATQESLHAVGLMARLPGWPADSLQRGAIPAAELAAAGDDDPRQIPAELVAILGDSRLKHWASVHCIAFSPDGAVLASTSQHCTVKLCDLARARLRGDFVRHSAQVYSVAFSPDGRTIASGDRDGTVQLWDAATGTVRQTWSVVRNRVALAFSPDGRLLALGDQVTSHRPNDPSVEINRGRVRLWDVAAGTERRTVSAMQLATPVSSVAFHPDAIGPNGPVLASTSRDGMVRFWDPLTGQQRHAISFGPPRRDISQIVFSPDGRHIATANGNGTVYILRLASPPGKSSPR